METVHLLKSPANAAHLARSIEQYRQGKLTQQELADA
jgi:antitoxin YefM